MSCTLPTTNVNAVRAEAFEGGSYAKNETPVETHQRTIPNLTNPRKWESQEVQNALNNFPTQIYI